MCNAASRGGIAYVTGTADLVEGKEAEAGNGSSELSTGATHPGDCTSQGRLWGSDSLLRGSEGGMGLLRPRKWLVSMSVIPTVGVGQGSYEVKALQPYSEA